MPGSAYEVPGREQMAGRLPSVTATLYLIYNEGYLGTTSDALLREELGGEAIRLTSLLAAMLPEQPEVLGLLALMLLNDARRDARVGGRRPRSPRRAGPRPLGPRADRSRARARPPRRRRRPGRAPTPFRPAIAAEHARAGSAAETDWPRIARLYRWLAEFDPSPVVELNRAAAVAESEGPAMPVWRSSDRSKASTTYQPYHVARADSSAGGRGIRRAAEAYRRAIELSSNPVQRSFLEQRLAGPQLARSSVGAVPA